MRYSILLPLFIVFILCFETSAQLVNKPTYSEGQFITTGNDTLKGYIECRDGYYNHVKYSYDKNLKQKLQIKTKFVKCLMLGDVTFDNITYDNKDYLMLRIVKGEISLYKYQEIVYGASAPTQGGVMFSTPSETESFYLKKDGEVIKIKKRKLHTTLKELMIDYQVLYPQIDQLNPNSDLLSYHLTNLLNKYNYRDKIPSR